MIYATTKQKYPCTFAFDTRVQSKVENAMAIMGWFSSDYYLSSKEKGYSTRVKILDKRGHKIQVKA